MTSNSSPKKKAVQKVVSDGVSVLVADDDASDLDGAQKNPDPLKPLDLPFPTRSPERFAKEFFRDFDWYLTALRAGYHLLEHNKMRSRKHIQMKDDRFLSALQEEACRVHMQTLMKVATGEGNQATIKAATDLRDGLDDLLKSVDNSVSQGVDNPGNKSKWNENN